jgi:tetratricopeptide (TPR) repeat protein
MIQKLLTVSLLLLTILGCTSSDQYVEQARILLKEEKTQEAISLLNKAIDADADNVDAFNMRGVAYFERKEFGNALLDFEQAVKLDPTFYRPYYNRALMKTSLGDVQGALADYSDAIRLIPDTARQSGADLYLNRGQLFAQQNQLQPAITDFTKAVELNPKNALAWYNRGNLYFQQKQLPQAAADFQKAVTTDPSFGKAFYGLGLSQLLSEQKEAGCLSLKQAQKLGYADAINAVKQYCQ